MVEVLLLPILNVLIMKIKIFNVFCLAEITPTLQLARTLISPEFATFLSSYHGHTHCILPKLV